MANPTTTTTVESTPPPIPDVAHLIGIHSGDGQLHAITHDHATWAVDRHQGDRWHVRTGAVCGASVEIARQWGEFRRGTEWTDRYAGGGDLCPRCTWTVALAQGTTDAELAAITPGELELAALRRLMPDPLLAVRVSRSILTRRSAVDAEYNPEHEIWAQLLGHAAEHRPVVLLPEGCAEGGCGDHDDEAGCYAATDTVACQPCSIRAEDWAGEWAGEYLCSIPAPCSVLTAMAKQYGPLPA